MDRLINGVLEFREKDYEEHRDLFQEIGKEQNPHTLFIGCSDSRVIPELITNTLPGELFVVRNIANIVPNYRISQEFLSTTSAIEYAVQVLEVEAIVVCGHSNCGGCKALYKDSEALKDIPHTKKWLELSGNVNNLVDKAIKDKDDPGEREWLTEQINVLEQIKHLLTYPFIAEKFQNRTLDILGWHYIIETGEVFSYNKDTSVFELIS